MIIVEETIEAAGGYARHSMDKDWTKPGGSTRAPFDPGLVALVSLARTGDLAAQSELFQRYRKRLAGFLWPMVRDREAVADIVQATCLKLVRRLPGLRKPEVFETWLFTLARNTALDHLRRDRRRPVLMFQGASEHDVRDPSSEDRSREIMEAVEDALRHSRASDLRILHQVIVDINYEQIAAQEGLSMSALKVRLYRLRRQLRALARGTLGDLFPRRAGAREVLP